LHLLVALTLSTAAYAAPCPPTASPPARIVSLSPSITETLFAIGAGSRVVGVSDFCTQPPAAAVLPRVGTGLSPAYERIAGLAPDLIVSEANVAVPAAALAQVGTVRLFPWLALADVLAGIRDLGCAVGAGDAAAALADRMAARLGARAPADAPRVLLVLGREADRLKDVWFIRSNSLHGAALEAAGGRNVVAAPVRGLPRMSLEELIALDPDIIVILTPDDAGDGGAHLLDGWRRLTALSAVRTDRLRVLTAPEAYANGPHILDLVDHLTPLLAELRAPR
jgi:iron complex transport system substrate-binding protein